MCPREFTNSFGFWNSGVAKKGDCVRTDGILGSSSCRRNVVPAVNALGKSAKIMLRVSVLCCTGSGVFLFRALDRLKVGVWKGREELVIRVAGVLVAGGCELWCGPGEYGGGDGRARTTGLCSVVSLIDDLCVVFSDTVVICAEFRLFHAMKQIIQSSSVTGKSMNLTSITEYEHSGFKK